MISPERVEQLKSYGIGGGGAAGGYASKQSGWLDGAETWLSKLAPWFSEFWVEFLALLQDLTIVCGFLLVVVRLAIDIRKWWRGRVGGKDNEAGKAVRGVAMAFAAVGGLAALLSLATPVLQGFEGKTNHAIIPVPGDVPTICHGHTATAEMGQVRTDEECEALLKQDLSEAFMAVARHVRVDMPKARWVAMASFVFNVGEGAFSKSTLLRKLNAGDTVGACNELRRWVYAAGRKLKGLERRREAERALCLQGGE